MQNISSSIEIPLKIVSISPIQGTRAPKDFSSRFTGKLYDAVLLAGEFLQLFPRRL